MQGAPRADGVRVHEAAGDRVLGGGEVPGRAWWRALCLKVQAEAGQRGGDCVADDGVGDDGAGDDGARDAGAGGDRAIEPEGLALDDQHGARYLRRGGDKCQRGSGLGVCRARRYAQRRVAQKRAAGLLLTSVGLARLQGGTAKGGQGEAPKACGRRRAEEGLCWRRRREPTYAHNRVPASPSAQQHIGRRMKACARMRWVLSVGRAGAVQGGQG